MSKDINYKPIKNPYFDNLPEYTKDPKNFKKIQRALLETLACGRIHSEPSEVFHCKKCNENVMERRKLMAKFGFKDAAQYMAWRKVHETIREKMPLVDWDKED